jgi:regulation of enolase protein 1 (concanavalin A-like superfamily)
MNPRSVLTSIVAAAALALAVAPPSRADVPASPWVVRDVGLPTPPGATDVDAAGVWTLQGSGMDIWDDYDQFQFASQPVRGDGSITARFLSVQGGDGEWTKAGLMVRDNDTPGAAHLLYAMTRVVGPFAQARFGQDSTCRAFGGAGLKYGLDANLIMRLQRSGQEFAGYYSRDGVLWHQAGFGPVAVPEIREEALWGLALTSHRDGSLATARFDQVSVQAGAALPYGIQTCGTDRAVLIQWRPLRGAVGYHVYRGAKDATRDQLARQTPELLTATSFVDSGSDLVNGTPVQYAVTAVFQGEDGNRVEGPPAAVFGTPVAVPEGMMGCSINEGPAPGSADFDPATGVITVRGSGFDIWNAQDQGYFLSVPVEGDVQVTVRLLSKHTSSDPGKPAGLMIREALEPGARNFLFGPLSTAGLFRQWRLNTNDWTEGAVSISEVAYKMPSVLRLTRQGDTITPEFSVDDGKTFQRARAITFPAPLARTLYVGVAVSSGRRTGAGRIQFRDLVIHRL